MTTEIPDGIDLEGLDDLEESVIRAIIDGVQKSDSLIHPDFNGPSHPIGRPPELTEEKKRDEGWLEKIKRKIDEIRNRDPEIYPLF